MKSQYRFEIFLLVHLILGAAIASAPVLVLPLFLLVLVVYGLYPTLRYRNVTGSAHLAAAYIAGLEMTVRASGAPLFYESAKLAVILLLGTGLLVERSRRPLPNGMLFFVLALLPSIIMMDFGLGLERIRQDLSFNLVGPVCLAVSMAYFYRRPLSPIQLAQLFQWILLAMTTTLGYLFIKTPSIKEITFTYSANFSASTFGPNQMASMLGYGILILVTIMLLRIPAFRFRPALWLLMAIMLYRGLLTFSRGGIFGPVIAIILGLLYFWGTTGILRGGNMRRLVVVALVALVGMLTFNYVNERTGNVLLERYTGQVGGKTLTLDKYSSGRSEILEIDWEIFKDHPLLGIGPGMGNWMRRDYGYATRVAAHIEFSRLPAEHGVFGIFALLILIGYPISEFLRRRKRPEWNFILATMVLSTFAFMTHSATRTALPMFMYGLGFIYLWHQAYRPKAFTRQARPKTELV